MRYIVVDLSDNKIVNAVEIDPFTQSPDNAWPIPEGHTILQSDTHQIGQIYEMPKE